MKVVLFCGGMGMRLRESAESLPKPLVTVGPRPILWNLMKYYAHYGHRDFILCLGHGAEAIKSYFLHYDERLSNDFVLRKGGADVELLARDIDDWTITFVDTGLRSNIGMRLLAVRRFLEGEDAFLANYADGLSDLPLDRYLDHFREHGRVASMLSVPAPQTFHMIHADKSGLVRSIEHVSHSAMRMNAGFFAFRREIFDYVREGEELVVEPFQRLIDARQLVAYEHDGFWMAMDTFKDKQQFEQLVASGSTPWRVWR
ncbi:MAG TPA: sugar phosphate nucleotidyltransferase [Myxococcota bacterium]|nr:sugar phosphate nucleotidyltransferase [Myxococcota bacterium]